MSGSQTETIIHATCVAVGGAGVLLIGAPGSGKSDLALRLIDSPGIAIGETTLKAKLVADDQVKLRRSGNQLIASPPVTLAGRLEIRGLGIVQVPHRASVKIGLAVELTEAAMIERLPDLAASGYTALGVTVALIRLDAMAASAPARLRAAVLNARLT